MLAKPIYVIDGARTPFLKSKNRPGPFSAADLATQAGRSLLARQGFAPDELKARAESAITALGGRLALDESTDDIRKLF